MGGDPVPCGSGVTSAVCASLRHAPEPGLASSGAGREGANALLGAGLGGDGADATAGAEATCSGTGACFAGGFSGSRASGVENAEDRGEEVLGNSSEPCGLTATSNSSTSKVSPKAPTPTNWASFLTLGANEWTSRSV